MLTKATHLLENDNNHHLRFSTNLSHSAGENYEAEDALEYSQKIVETQADFIGSLCNTDSIIHKSFDNVQ